eukprot:gnl/MRDRNA2_/MRDRNA2_268386_c0_seq1.p1 gnl/MRDRNA2_/MRDRNA2_268386_c0~~gnl/MRDRNA2_/MRDRNA2_268386_c0_seq1.p1  ORF type:complete len:133 (+),score=34.92 gnl/MRDRNA2_/MRDRNA2_268386_c0_seq1:25-399(+)
MAIVLGEVALEPAIVKEEKTVLLVTPSPATTPTPEESASSTLAQLTSTASQAQRFVEEDGTNGTVQGLDVKQQTEKEESNDLLGMVPLSNEMLIYVGAGLGGLILLCFGACMCRRWQKKRHEQE